MRSLRPTKSYWPFDGKQALLYTKLHSLPEKTLFHQHKLEEILPLDYHRWNKLRIPRADIFYVKKSMGPFELCLEERGEGPKYEINE